MKSEDLPQRRQGAKVRDEEVNLFVDGINFSSELGVFAPWRENYPNPRLLDWWDICADAAIHCAQEIP